MSINVIERNGSIIIIIIIIKIIILGAWGG
jgi:hypothetical protein